MSDLEKRIDRLESLEAIRKLKHTYCKYCDENYNPEKLKTLFWDDAVWDAGPQFGEHKGPEAIGKFFAEVSGSFLWARHYVINERIELSEDGHSAKGEWQIIEPCTLKGENGPEASWLMAQYNDVYTRRHGVWKFQRLQADIAFMVPHATGWAEATTPKG
jgi:hypothetical protein